MADDTREQRICLAKQAYDKRQREAFGGIATKVKQIAGRLDLSLLERRRLVFDLWDECSEGPGDSPVDYGSEARALILSAIRATFPEGGALAYQPGELVALNRRRSSGERFAPYERHTARARTSTGGAPGATSCP